MVLRLDAKATKFDDAIRSMLQREDVLDPDILATAQKIISRIRDIGDKALIDYTKQFDDFDLDNGRMLEISSGSREAAFNGLQSTLRSSLEKAAERIHEFHERQKDVSWEYYDENGSRFGQKLTPLDRVGIYVPGGKAAYPSSVLMTAIPARVAGVKEIVMVVPTPKGKENQLVLAASHLCKVDRVFGIGGAQAVAALAFGTETIPKVDKIVGPGNSYVAAAKKILYGQVGIDMIAGPSEVVVIADAGADPRWVTLDLFAQAEHDEHAQSILISPDQQLLNRVEAEIQQLLPTMERQEIIEASLKNHCVLIEVESLEGAVKIANEIAPEHLQLMVENPHQLLNQVRHAGAVFCGYWSAESLGDYCAGPNHVLPTSGTARFSSPLGVYDFQKRSSVVWCSAEGASELSSVASVLAECEGLFAHALSASCRARK